jgi:predicted alpha/beta hydrolase
VQTLIHSDSWIQLPHRNLHLHRIHDESAGKPLLFIHGALEDGRIFYTLKSKGLAPFLAAQGFDCYIADMGGRGKSEPHASSGINYGHQRAIEEDFPALINYVFQQSNQQQSRS